MSGFRVSCNVSLALRFSPPLSLPGHSWGLLPSDTTGGWRPSPHTKNESWNFVASAEIECCTSGGRRGVGQTAAPICLSISACMQSMTTIPKRKVGHFRIIIGRVPALTEPRRESESRPRKLLSRPPPRPRRPSSAREQGRSRSRPRPRLAARLVARLAARLAARPVARLAAISRRDWLGTRAFPVSVPGKAEGVRLAFTNALSRAMIGRSGSARMEPLALCLAAAAASER